MNSIPTVRHPYVKHLLALVSKLSPTRRVEIAQAIQENLPKWSQMPEDQGIEAIRSFIEAIKESK